MPQQLSLIETELKCITCSLPLKTHTTTQLRNCDSLRRNKENIAKHRIIENVERQQLVTKLTKDSKQ